MIYSHRIPLLFIISLIFLLLPSRSSADPVNIYLLGGQSNMQGIGLLNKLTPAQRAVPDHVYFWNNRAFEPMQMGRTRTSVRATDFGPELGLAQVLRRHVGNVYLIKFHTSGMPLNRGWNGNRWVGGGGPGRRNFFPGIDQRDVNHGELYHAMLDRFKAGIAAVRAQGHTPIVRGFVWMQGEQDSKHPRSAILYAANLKLLKTRLQQDLGLATLPMVYGQVLPHVPALPRFTHRDVIRQQMAAADMNSGQPEAIPDARMVSTDHFPLRADHVHYNAQGQLMLGQAFGQALTGEQALENTVTLWRNGVPGFPQHNHGPSLQRSDPTHYSLVTKPFMTVFLADPRIATGHAVVIFPGGGYRVLADKKEGSDVAEYFASQGISCFVVNYRVSRLGNSKSFQYPGPQLDARKAMRIIHARAREWHIDTRKIGVMGFSAGGHLAAVTGTNYNDPLRIAAVAGIVPILDNGGPQVKPAFTCLIYPVVSMVSPLTHHGSKNALLGINPPHNLLLKLSAEKRVKRGDSPFFISGGQRDFVRSEPLIDLLSACKRQNVDCEFHLFPISDHGYGMGRPRQTKATNPGISWVPLCLDFIKRQ